MKIEGRGFIDDLQFAANPQKARRELLVTRTYQAVAERLDLTHGAGWVEWRRLLNLGSSHE